MNFDFSDDQKLLRDQARKFLFDKCDRKSVRTVLDDDQLHYHKELWSQISELGWTGTAIPEEYGGSNFGLSGIGVVLQELGSTLTPSPLFATAVLGASLISKLGSEEQKKKYLPGIANGNLTCAFAFEDGPRHNPIVSEVTAEKKGDKFLINGKKCFVVDGGFADLIIIAAKSPKGTSLFITNKNSKGMEVREAKMVDSRNSANIIFTDLEINRNTKLIIEISSFQLSKIKELKFDQAFLLNISKDYWSFFILTAISYTKHYNTHIADPLVSFPIGMSQIARPPT